VPPLGGNRPPIATTSNSKVIVRASRRVTPSTGRIFLVVPLCRRRSTSRCRCRASSTLARLPMLAGRGGQGPIAISPDRVGRSPFYSSGSFRLNFLFQFPDLFQTPVGFQISYKFEISSKIHEINYVRFLFSNLSTKIVNTLSTHEISY
jgi:hypothetical protein